MSNDRSPVPQPRVSGLDVSDSALLATLLHEAPIGFAFFGPDLRFRRINRDPGLGCTAWIWKLTSACCRPRSGRGSLAPTGRVRGPARAG